MSAVYWMVKNRYFPPQEITTPLNGKVYLITGGMGGLGLETTRSLARRGATVLCGVRSLARGQSALDELEAFDPSLAGRVHLFKLDLASFAATREGAERAKKLVEKMGGKLDGLINNAARLTAPYEIGADGFELSPQTNYLSPVLFTELLLPNLENTAAQSGSDVRIVWVASNAGMVAPADWDFVDASSFDNKCTKPGKDVNEFWSSFSRYGVSKMLPTVYIDDLQKRLRNKGSSILAISLNPGGVKTEKTVGMPFPLGLIARLFFLPPSSATFTSLFALTSPAVRAREEHFGGKYLEPFDRLEEVPGPKKLSDEETRERLRRVTRESLRVQGVEMQ
ncbi:hypothetical protein JCM8097_006626 [Rhodosporidiobolus ruineniae]